MLIVTKLHRPGLIPASFSVNDGECLAIMGASGSGKSLLLRAIADLDPNQGEVETDNMARSSVPAPDWRRSVGYLAPESGWWADDVGAHFADKNKGLALACELGLPASCLDWPVSRLSTGEKQRLALARLLERETDILLLDEPTSALDAKSRKSAEKLLHKQLSRGATIIMVTHDKKQAKRFAARTLNMTSGQLVENAA